MAAETSQTLDRGLRVLEVLAENHEGLTVTEIATSLGVSRTVVYRLVVTLEQHGLLRRAADGRCRLGMGVLNLARQAQPLLRDAALPILRRLAEATASTAYLGVVDGGDLLTLAVAEPRSDVHVAYRVGARMPLERGAAGRAVLAARRTGGRPQDPPWVVAAGDPQVGGAGIAAVVPGSVAVEAVVGVVTFTDPDEQGIGPRVARAAADIARALG